MMQRLLIGVVKGYRLFLSPWLGSACRFEPTCSVYSLQALEQHAPDLLITDVEMPGIDGFELTRRLRGQPRFARLPVIMITSSDARHRAEANAAGVNLLLGKPYAEETLLAQVQALLAAHLRQAGSGLAVH